MTPGKKKQTPPAPRKMPTPPLNKNQPSPLVQKKGEPTPKISPKKVNLPSPSYKKLARSQTEPVTALKDGDKGTIKPRKLRKSKYAGLVIPQRPFTSPKSHSTEEPVDTESTDALPVETDTGKSEVQILLSSL